MGFSRVLGTCRNWHSVQLLARGKSDDSRPPFTIRAQKPEMPSFPCSAQHNATHSPTHHHSHAPFPAPHASAVCGPVAPGTTVVFTLCPTLHPQTPSPDTPPPAAHAVLPFENPRPSLDRSLYRSLPPQYPRLRDVWSWRRLLRGGLGSLACVRPQRLLAGMQAAEYFDAKREAFAQVGGRRAAAVLGSSTHVGRDGSTVAKGRAGGWGGEGGAVSVHGVAGVVPWHS